MELCGLFQVFTRQSIFQKMLLDHIPVLSHATHEEVEGFALISASSSACPQLTVFIQAISKSVKFWQVWFCGRFGVVVVFYHLSIVSSVMHWLYHRKLGTCHHTKCKAHPWPHRTRKPLASQALMSMGSMGLQTVDVSGVTTILAAEAAVAILGVVRWTVFHRGSSASGFLNMWVQHP